MGDAGIFLTSKIFWIYVFGGVIIILYAKDKFNMPTYDRNVMGPFAQLPPQFLTIDARYQWGKFVYVALMLSLYSAICVVGPLSFSNILSALGSSLGGAVSKSADNEVWPVAAAAFLISTGAANDNSFFGRIELIIRQFAHKSAYIPGTVSDLAFTLRTVNVTQWLLSNPYVQPSELRERQRGLTLLVGVEAIGKVKNDPDREGQLAAWVRANILFYILHQIFDKLPGHTSDKMERLVDLPENQQIFDNLRTTRELLATEFAGPAQRTEDESTDVLSRVQRFAKDTSLMIAVLLSQTARNAGYLTDRLDQLGFQGVDLRDRSDHFTYTVMVTVFTAIGAVLVAGCLAAAWLPKLKNLTWIHDIDLTGGTITILTGTVVYIVLFKSMDYWRDRSLDSLDWRENLQSYVTLTLSASLLSCAVSTVLLVLVFFVTDTTDRVLNGPVAFAQLLIFNFFAAALGTVFGLLYMRQAARMPSRKVILTRNLFSGTAFMHAVIAAVFVGLLNLSIYMYSIYSAPKSLFDALQVTAPMLSTEPKLGYSIMYSASQLAAYAGRINEMSGDMQKLEIGTATAPLNKLRAICDFMSEPQVGAAAFQAAPDDKSNAARAAAAENPKPPSLFAAPKSCKPNNIGDDPRSGIAGLLSAFETSLVAMDQAVTQQYFAWAFPALAAFLIAYCFGVGCRHWRAWWLNNDEDYLADLKAQITAAYGADVDVDACLIWPVPLLGSLTPIEAIRYEDYRTRLLANVQRKKIVWPSSCYRANTVAHDRNVGTTLVAASVP